MLAGVIGAVTATALVLPTSFASPGGGGGGAGGGGGGGGGSGSGTTTGSIYSDLVIALRDTKGAPILQSYTVPATAETAAAVEYCVQPVSYQAIPGVSSRTNPVDGRTVWVVPLQGAWIVDNTVPADFTGACDAQPQYGMFISEVELERLNLARTAESVITSKLADVTLKFRFADEITLESTGRLSWDGTPIDASPENAAIYQSLMKTGTIPGLPTTMAGPPAVVGPMPVDATSNSRFDAWELAAMTIGAAASKSTPLTVDAVEYYNRIIGFPPTADYTTTWPGGPTFVRSADPDVTDAISMDASEQFVDYSSFTYDRSQTFKGSVTWLDVSTLTWKVSKITDVVPFTNLSSFDEIGVNVLTGITAFAQLADDVRAMCNYVPDNTFIPGFFMDVPGRDTTADQLKAIHDPAVDLGTLPENVFQTLPFEMTASLLNPFGGEPIDTAQLRVTIHAATAFAAGDVTAVSKTDGQDAPFTLDANGDLVGKWGPDTGFPVNRGYNVSTVFTVTVADSAPLGAYVLTLELIDVDAPEAVLAAESGTITVNENATTVLWGTPLPRYTTQGSAMTLPLQVYAPEQGTGVLNLTVTGPVEDPATPDSEALAVGDLQVYASVGTDMVAMPLSLDATGHLVGTWNATLLAGYTPVTWYVTFAEGAPVGSYALGVGLTDGNNLAPISVVVFAPETHGEKPPSAGEDTTAPVVTVTYGDLGTDASFTLTADEDGVTFECMLTKDDVVIHDWAACEATVAYTSLAPGTYVFSARGTDRVGLVSEIKTVTWTVEVPADLTAPVVTATAVGTLAATASFTITSDDADATLECKLTKDHVVYSAWAACSSPVAFTNLTGGTYVLAVRGTDKAGNTSAIFETSSWTVESAPGSFVAVLPSRLLDTRTTGPMLGSTQTRSLQVTGVGGVPTSQVSAVMLNVTVTDTSDNGYLTVSPTGSSRPVVSNLNWSAGATIPNAVTVKVGANGQVDLYQSGPGTANVIVDVAGYFVAGTVAEPGGFVSLAPSRILDTRITGGPLSSIEARDLAILGSGGVPESNVSAVVMNVTVTDTTASGYLTVFPSGTTRPTASNLNWVPGLTVPNLVTVKVGDTGKVSIFQSGPGTADVVVDVAGYYLGGTPTQPGMFVAVAPTRVLDTRSGKAMGGGSDSSLTILGKGGIPARGASAVVLNTTVTDTTMAGYLTVFPGTDPAPTASNLNWSGRDATVANLVTVQIGSSGSISFHNGSAGEAHVVFDIAGYYIGA